MASSTVSDYLSRLSAAGLGWPLPEDLDDGRLEAMLYPPPAPSKQPRAVPDWSQIHKELAEHIKLVRAWGPRFHAGQPVGRDLVVEDGDVLEFHEQPG